MRLEPEGPPDPGDRRLGHTRGPGHRASRPLRCVERCLLQRLDDHPLDVVVAGSTVVHPAGAHRSTRPNEHGGTGAATWRPSPAPHPAELRPPSWSRPQRKPTRHDNPTPTPEHSSVAAPNAAESRAPPRSTPAAQDEDPA